MGLLPEYTLACPLILQCNSSYLCFSLCLLSARTENNGLITVKLSLKVVIYYLSHHPSTFLVSTE